MKPAENIEKFVKNLELDIDINEKTDQRILKELIEAHEKSKEMKSTLIEQNIGKMILESNITKIAAALLIIFSLTACFVLSGKVTNLRNELDQARRDVALAQQNTAPTQTDDTTTINFYLKEHQEVVAQHASMNQNMAEPAQMHVNKHDIMYYESFDDGPEYMSPGIIVRGPSYQQQTGTSEAPVISNGHTLSLSEARQAADFDLVLPSWLDPGYALDQIRMIEDRDAVQLLYTDGINSVSLFEQPLDGQRGLEPKDFREYAMYRNKKQAAGTILAWRNNARSFVLIGNGELSQLMNMAQSISAGK